MPIPLFLIVLGAGAAVVVASSSSSSSPARRLDDARTRVSAERAELTQRRVRSAWQLRQQAKAEQRLRAGKVGSFLQAGITAKHAVQGATGYKLPTRPGPGGLMRSYRRGRR